MKKDVLLPILVFLLLFVIWEILSRSFSHLIFVLPPPSSIILRIIKNWKMFAFHSGHTLKEMLGGIFLAFSFAFPLAWLMYAFRSLRTILQPLFILIQCVPMFTLAPIMVIWFGWSFTAIIIPTALMIFFPLTINLYQGFSSSPKAFYDLFQLHQATAWQTFYKLQLPWTIPYLYAGFRISTAIAGIGAIAGEWAGAQAGLGLLMIESKRALDLEATFGALFCLTGLTLLFYTTAIILEKKLSMKKFTYLKSALPITVLFLSLILFTGCEKNQTSHPKTRLVLDWLPNPHHIPLYVGIEKGYFQEAGIDLAILKVHDPSDPIPYLISGKAELAISYLPHTLRQQSKGMPLDIVGILIDEPLNSLIYRKGEGIESPKDLNGKIIGYCYVDSREEKLLNLIFQSNHFQPAKMKNVQFDLVSALGTRQCDCLYGAYWNIEGEQLRQRGIETEHFSLQELGLPSYEELVILAKTGSQIATHDFSRSLQKSIEYCRKNPEEAFNIYLTFNPDKGAQTISWERGAWNDTLPLFAKKQQFNKEKWAQFSKWLIENDLF